MSTYTQILYQIVFATRNRLPVLHKSNRDQLYKLIWKILEDHKCHPYYINGVEDHIHIATDLHPSVALSNLVKDIKVITTKAIKEHKLFPHFECWQEGYGAFTYSIKDKDKLLNYILNQEKHHQSDSSKKELFKLLNEHLVQYDLKYLY